MRRSPYEWIRVRVAPKYYKKLQQLARRRKTTLTSIVESLIEKEENRDKRT